jgi:predicted DNA binding CopG/RHH family protein
MADKNAVSLDGLIQAKGAPRPDALVQRVESPAKVLQTSLETSITTSAAPAPAAKEPRAKSLTLRLSEGQYERLRRFAFEQRLSHQDIIERALIEYLARQERSA